MSWPRVRDAGDSALLLELEPVIDESVNQRAIAIAAALRREPIAGIRDVVPTYRSVAVHFDPLAVDVEVVRDAIARARSTPAIARDSRLLEVPVTYGGDAGPDLADVAALVGVPADDVIARHVSREYRVFMLGFLPGFAYMGSVDPAIAVPRRASPRTRVPAGSVGIAGQQTGIYPMESPGGWQIIGRTELAIFDPQRTPAAVFAPGDRVRFVRRETSGTRTPAGTPGGAESPAYSTGRALTVLSPGLFTTVQDSGRWGHQSEGVPVSGAMDWFSHRRANALVGNRPDAASLEATLLGPELRVEHSATIAVAGANLTATIDGAPVAMERPTSCSAGSVLRFGQRHSGARAYVAFDGGIDVPDVLGSKSTHVRSGLGGCNGRALRAGDRISLGAAEPPRVFRHTSSNEIDVRGGARLRVLLGPQDELFSPEAIRTLLQSRFTISTASDRMGYRLSGERVTRSDGGEMISDATFLGAVQIPPSGEPILLLVDRQTVGGYPQIATVITADVPLAGQLAPGDWIEFEQCSRVEAIAALEAREAAVHAID